MNNLSKIRVIFVFLLVLLGIVYAIPNFISTSVKSNSVNFIPGKTINLGLDLKGGSYLLLKADMNIVFSEKLETLTEFLILPRPTDNSNPSWFGFPITLRDSAGTSRRDLLEYLDQNKIGSRLVFAGNITKQPYFKNIDYRVVGTLEDTDIVMNQTFWIGVYPGLTTEMLDYVVETMEGYFGIGF